MTKVSFLATTNIQKLFEKNKLLQNFFEKIIIFQVVVVGVTNRGDGYRCFQGC